MRQRNKIRIIRAFNYSIIHEILNIRTITFYVILNFFMSASVIAQEPGINTNLRPNIKSPEVTKFEQYTNMPVNMVTGTPQVSIPLFNIDYFGINVPITLEYYASGVKVDAISSSVGLSWTLNVGGAVSRIVKGAPDEGNPYSNALSLIDIDGYYQDYGLTKLETELNRFAQGNANNGGEIHERSTQFNFWMSDIGNGYKDSQPDLFYFSTPEGGSKFVFNQARQVVYLENTDFLIKENFLTNTFTSWDVTSPNGLKYKFGLNDTNESSYTAGTGEITNQFIVNSWFLNEIINLANNKTINVDYIDNNYSDYFTNNPFKSSYPCMTSPYNSTVIGECGDGVGSYSTFASSPYSSNSSQFPSLMNYQYMESNVKSKLISKITAGLTTVDFIYENREDLVQESNVYPKSLKTIMISYNGNCVKKFQFNYSYKISGDNPPASFNSTFRDALKKRLFLDKLVEESCNTNVKKEYQFVYNTTVLPSRTSYARDKWGYYNGKTGNNSLFPAYLNSNFSNVANRSVDVNFSKAGTLEKIIYPTGGTVEFTYGGHVSNEPTDDLIAAWPTNPNITLNSQASNNYTSSTFNVTADKFYKLNISMLDVKGYTSCGAGTLLKITKSGNTSGVPDYSYSYQALVNNPNFNNGQAYDGNTTVDVVFDMSYLDGPGIYNIEVFGYNEGTSGTCLAAIVKLYETGIVPTYDIGGIRVEKITHKDSNGTVAKTLTYTYTSPHVIYNPKPVHRAQYNYYNIYDNLYGIISTSNLNYLRTVSINYDLYSNPGSSMMEGYYYLMSPGHDPLSIDFMGPHISYGKVQESNGNINTEYTFQPYKSFFELNGYQNTVIYPPNPKMQSILSGSETSNTKYGEVSDLFTQKFYSYSTYLTNVVGLNVSGQAGTTTVRPFDQYVIEGQVKKLQGESTAEDFGNVVFESQSEYFYEGNGHNMWTKRQIIDSDGHITETKLYYPDDVVNVNSLPGETLTVVEHNAINVLKSQYRKNIPLQTDNKDNGQLLSTRTIYKDWYPSANGGRIVEPQFIKTLKGVYHATTNPYQTRTTFYDYDTYGKPLEVGQSSGPHTSYLWGYGNQLPVAKADNATYSQLTGTGIVLSTINSASTNDQTMRNELNKLRTLSNSFATTYTYAPLIGLTSETDPTGYTTFYDYDDFNRLKYIENKDSKVLKSYAYNYKTDLPQYTVTSTTNGNGTVSLSATVVSQGGSVIVTVSPNSGYQINTIKVNGVTRSNTSPFTLTNITSNTVIDVQFTAATSSLTVTPSSITFEFIAEPVTITVGASGSWTVSKSASWITISATSGSGNGSFNVSALKNTGPERTGTVTVTQGSTVKTIAILQIEGI